jgi:16S rRNA (cytosine967-C5)-methyltransferase
MERENVREIALAALVRIMEKQEYCDKVLHDVLEQYAFLEKRDRAFVTRLVEGCVERCIELDFVLDRYSKIPVKKMKPLVREILRSGTYQIMYMDQVPDSAACNEAVKMAVAHGLMPLKGFVNGILRNVARFHNDTPYPQRKKNLAAHLSVWYSMPEWIVKRWLQQYGEQETEAILQRFLEDGKGTGVRCNLSLASKKSIIDSLEKQNVTVTPGKLFENALNISGYGRLNQLEAFQKGWIQVQDESSMIVGELAPVTIESTVIDVCAAPGGKALHLADRMEGQGLIRACDIAKDKVSLIRENLIRMGIHNVKLKKQDATVLLEPWIETADVVIADLPCSGLGVIGHKADIKYKTKPEDIPVLARQQQKILKTACQYLKPGGTFLYSTCTIAPEENEQQAAWIVQNLPLKAVSIEDSLPQPLRHRTGEKGYLQILPSMAGGDGFFVAVFQKE